MEQLLHTAVVLIGERHGGKLCAEDQGFLSYLPMGPEPCTGEPFIVRSEDKARCPLRNNANKCLSMSQIEDQPVMDLSRNIHQKEAARCSG